MKYNRKRDCHFESNMGPLRGKEKGHTVTIVAHSSEALKRTSQITWTHISKNNRPCPPATMEGEWQRERERACEKETRDGIISFSGSYRRKDRVACLFISGALIMAIAFLSFSPPAILQFCPAQHNSCWFIAAQDVSLTQLNCLSYCRCPCDSLQRLEAWASGNTNG